MGEEIDKAGVIQMDNVVSSIGVLCIGYVGGGRRSKGGE